MSVRAKICGIRNLSDARMAWEAGADALGFVFYENSPRVITPSEAAAIIREIPPFISKVGLFVNSPPEVVERIRVECGLDTLQFHGDDSPDYCAAFRPVAKVIKAFRVQNSQVLEIAALYREAADAWLFDTYVPGVPGGTGRTFNWTIAMEARLLGRPIILSGGLTPDNVSEAIRRVHPFAVDVSSGVESEPGSKDRDKVEAFLNAAHGL